MSGELDVLAAALLRLARADRRTRDYTLNALRNALAEVVASFPVYRTYIADDGRVSAQDRRSSTGRSAARGAGAAAPTPACSTSCAACCSAEPLPGAPPALADGYRASRGGCSSSPRPVTAKGIEDTALYRLPPADLAQRRRRRPRRFRHDGDGASTARARDRARTGRTRCSPPRRTTTSARRTCARASTCISEMPAAWRLTRAPLEPAEPQPQARRGRQAGADAQRRIPAVPDAGRQRAHGSPSGEALAAYSERIEQAMLKAAREAKVDTSWINPNEAYETALVEFVRALLARHEGAPTCSSTICARWRGSSRGTAR